ncbi:MAG: YciI family protein [Actinomycetota bacterium]|nr:YciI family protein [Actinomycetota bacterium]
MSKFMLLIYANPTEVAALSDAEGAVLGQEYGAFTQELAASGAMLGGDALAYPQEGKSIGRDGVVTDGPFAEATEFLGGFYLVDLPDMAEALRWGAKLPGAVRGLDRIEVRQIQEQPGGQQG